jgi:ABC-type lipoprotein release transport system permease subunit
VTLLAAIPAYRVARARPADAADARPSRVAALAADAGLPVPAAAGVRMALEPGRGRTSVPVRTTIVSAGLAIATVVAAVVFASSLQHLVSTPRLFGWNWDRQLVVSPSDDRDVNASIHDQIAEQLAHSSAIARWGTVSLSDLPVNGTSVPAVGIDTRRDAAMPTVVSGRLPTRGDEVALGHLTQRQLGVGQGDTVTSRTRDGAGTRLKVVGTVVLPGLGTYPGSDKTALGEGAVVTRDALHNLAPNFQRDNFVVKFAADASPSARRAAVADAATIARAVDPESFTSDNVQRPSDIIAYDRVRSTPLALALVLAMLAFATVTHALVSAVRRRRRDLAMLATLGLTRRQVSSTIAWQATTVGVCALLIGIPLGIIGGRWAWSFLAHDLGTISEPRVPVLALALGVPVVLLLCNLVAYIPGRLAARLRPAVVLRSE